MANIKNLKPIQKGELSSEEAKKRGKNGGIKSGLKRIEKRLMKDILQILLETEVMQDKQLKSAKEAMLFSVVKNAINGDLKAIEFIQSTIGEKPIYNSNSTADPQRVAEVQEIINELISH